jgi:O-antigen/teichoic acid export membrane protein
MISVLFRSILSNWVGVGVTAALSIFLTPVLIKGLGPFQYGLWVLTASVLDYYGLLDFGIRTTLHRFVGRLHGIDERVALMETLATGLAISVIVGAIVIVLTLLLMVALPPFFVTDVSDVRMLQLTVLLLGLSAAVGFPARVLGAYLCGLQRFDLFNTAAVGTGVVRAALLVGAVRLGYGLVGVSAVTLGISILTLLLHWGFVHWVDAKMKVRWRDVSVTRVRELLGFSAYVFLTTLGDYLRFYTSSLVIGRVLSIAQITPFSVASRLMEYFKLVIFAALGPLMPLMSALDGQQRQRELRQLFITGTRLTALLTGGLAGLLWLDGEAVITLWIGPDFTESYWLALILAVGFGISLAQSPSVVVLQARARHHVVGVWTLLEGVANVLLSVYWARRYGLVGVALGTIVPMLCVKILVQPAYTLRTLQIPWRTYLGSAFARPALVCATFIALAAPWKPSVGGALVSVGAVLVAQTALFVGLTYLVGLTGEERRHMHNRARILLSQRGLIAAEDKV